MHSGLNADYITKCNSAIVVPDCTQTLKNIEKLVTYDSINIYPNKLHGNFFNRIDDFLTATDQISTAIDDFLTKIADTL